MNRPALRFLAILKRLDNYFLHAINSTNSQEKEIYLSYITIKIHDQWNFRSKQVVLNNYGKSDREMTQELRTQWSPTKTMPATWELDWHIPSNAIRAGRILNIRNLNDVQNALGAATFIDDIRWTRNAIVHNISKSFSKYRHMILSKYRLQNIPPYQLITEINPATGNTIYQDWCDELFSVLSVSYKQ